LIKPAAPKAGPPSAETLNLKTLSLGSMLTLAEENYILANLYVPEHIPGLITNLSAREPFLIDDHVVCRNDNWIIFIGYPLQQQFDELDRKTIDKITHEITPKCRDRIIDFLKQVDRWPKLAREYAACYLAGDLETLRSKGLRFPSRHHSVLDRRDQIFFERVDEYLKQGDAVAFVGAPHVSGMSKLLREDGYKITGPGIHAANHRPQMPKDR
jgi:hypothetical protein